MGKKAKVPSEKTNLWQITNKRIWSLGERTMDIYNFPIDLHNFVEHMPVICFTTNINFNYALGQLIGELTNQRINGYDEDIFIEANIVGFHGPADIAGPSSNPRVYYAAALHKNAASNKKYHTSKVFLFSDELNITIDEVQKNIHNYNACKLHEITVRKNRPKYDLLKTGIDTTLLAEPSEKYVDNYRVSDFPRDSV